MSERIDGVVKWFSNSRGYGFLLDGEENEYFVHFSSINVEGYKTLSKGQAVNFAIKNTQDGIQAVDVSPV